MMTDTPDMELVRQFARDHSEAAFTELVRRHIHFVYSIAWRRTGNTGDANDVAQAVFITLARKAASLGDKTVLAGWLYETTRFTAARQLRANIRRATREQEAYMQSALDENTENVWTQLAPHLEAAMDGLSAADRTLLALRFYENKTASQAAALLGIREEAAQRRAGRAVDKLRKFFMKRGVTLTAAAIAGALSANAVQAAPAGFASTISLALSQTTTTTAAMAATKAITMTTLQKIAVTAALAATIGTGWYETIQARNAQAEAQALKAQQAQLAGQIQQVQNNFGDATNRLALALAEVAQMKAGRDQSELLKLRGQTGVLRQQLAFMQAKMNLPTSGLEKLMADPAMKAMVDQQARTAITMRYADLFRELKLSPSQIEKFAMVYANSGLHQTDVEGELRGLLGDQGYARFNEFTQEIPARTTVQLLNSQLGANQLTDGQDAQLLQVVKTEPYDLIYGIEGDLNTAFLGPQDQVDDYVRQVTASNGRIVQKAEAFLTPDQSTVLNGVLTNALSARIGQAAALLPKH